MYGVRLCSLGFRVFISGRVRLQAVRSRVSRCQKLCLLASEVGFAKPGSSPKPKSWPVRPFAKVPVFLLLYSQPLETQSSRKPPFKRTRIEYQLSCFVPYFPFESRFRCPRPHKKPSFIFACLSVQQERIQQCETSIVAMLPITPSSPLLSPFCVRNDQRDIGE